jgi:PadR family transcriptional regulator PadR
MDNVQLMKGVLEGCILAIIAKCETYGYEILVSLEKCGFEDVGEGTVYPIITRLDKGGYISCRRAKSPLGPMRKYYSITPTGEKMLEEFKARYERITESAKKVLYE